MPQSYPNYVAGVPDGSSTALASIAGAGVRTLGGRVNTLTSAGASRNILDDGAGNATVAGTLTVTGAIALTGNVAITGNLSVTGTLGVTGTATFAGQIQANAGIVLGAGQVLSGEQTTNPVFAISPTFASGTTVQNPNAYDTRVTQLISSTGGTGTYAVAIGSTSGVSISLGTFQQATGQNLPFIFDLPGSWFIKITLTTLTFGAAAPTWV